MNIQEIVLSHNQKKKLLKSIDEKTVIFQDDNGDIVVNVEAYLSLKQNSDSAPIEKLIGEEVLDFDSEYFLFI